MSSIKSQKSNLHPDDVAVIHQMIDSIPSFPGKDISEYRVLWNGPYMGGKLWILCRPVDPYMIHFLIRDIPSEIPYIGHIQLYDISSSPEEILEFVMESIEAAYVRAQVTLMNHAIGSHNMRIH